MAKKPGIITVEVDARDNSDLQTLIDNGIVEAVHIPGYGAWWYLVAAKGVDKKVLKNIASKIAGK